MREPHPSRPLAIVLAILSSGCSWAMVARPPPLPVEPLAPLACTTETAPPIVDAVVAATGITAGALAVALSDRAGYCADSSTATSTARCPRDRSLVVGGLVAMGLGVVAGASSVTGLSRTARCHELDRLQRACWAGVEPSCAALKARPSLQVVPPRVERPRAGFAPGESCAADTECRAGLDCRLGRCATPAAP